MHNLILKDLLLQKKIILFSFVYIVFFAVAMQGEGLVLYPMSLIALTYMFVLTACAYDDKNKADVMLNSLPVKRASIVLARYLSIFVYIAIGTAVYLVTTTFISLIGFPVKNCPVSLEGLAGGLLSISLITGIYLPFYFKLGYIKSRSLNFILFFTFFFGITSTANYLFKNRDAAWAQNIMIFFQSLSNLQILALFTGLILIMLTISFTLSLKAYQCRDL